MADSSVEFCHLKIRAAGLSGPQRGFGFELGLFASNSSRVPLKGFYRRATIRGITFFFVFHSLFFFFTSRCRISAGFLEGFARFSVQFQFYNLVCIGFSGSYSGYIVIYLYTKKKYNIFVYIYISTHITYINVRCV